MIILHLLDPWKRTPVKTWRFPIKTTIRIGRAADNDVILNDILISRYHAELCCYRDPENLGRWYLKSLGAIGTFVDGRLVDESKLASGSLIQLGPTGPILEFHEQTFRRSAPTLSECTHAGNMPGNLFCIHCGQPLNVQRTVRNYHILRLLGHGGIGTTYLACEAQPSGGWTGKVPEVWVLKELRSDMEDNEKAQELFEREARILQLLDHAGIPRFYDFFVEDGKSYLVMELIHGIDLERWVLRNGTVPIPQAVQWMIQTCGVLDYLHNQDPPVIHRDLKPSNLLVRSRDNQIVLIDFGAVKELGHSPGGTRIAVEGYSAPEQMMGQPTIQSDLFAVGATLAFLLLGDSPIRFYHHCDGFHRLDVSDRPEIPDPLKQVLHRATAPLLPDRYPSAIALAKALREALAAVSQASSHV
ncbi:protein kinase [Thermosynechococcus sp. GLH187]|uniref:protein kinase domain-containing protein n=1 Tax=unclassified Thermosynechococcus TaxID=2622553 RepID=UPI002670E101|nr:MULTISPECIES: protein kinase [unclassified Thermosynechococcus]MDR7923029.1 protein kinase [Thermosynechococcus sp. HY213]WKT81148.1 protein kinase [Thermosynechococcus sp. PP45]WNC22206.1 protein kinase [Thermosynechococcus sp. PP22]WNC24759.1 protein kinase [Thermosynechococcus sp. PP551]WNC27336.1 protein kinase [Thermosynechococcus sp. PP555]